MTGAVSRFVRNRAFDFGDLAAAQTQSIVLERRLGVEGATTGSLAVAVHAAAFGDRDQKVVVRVSAIAPQTNEPETDMVASTALASVTIDQSVSAGRLLLDGFSGDHGQWVRVEIAATQAAPLSGPPSTTFSCQLTAEVVTKAPPEERDEEIVERVLEESVVPLVLRARQCVPEPGPGYTPVRIGPIGGRPRLPRPMDVDRLLSLLPELVRKAGCDCDVPPAPTRPTRKAIEQIVTALQDAALGDPRTLAFDRSLGLEPSIMLPTFHGRERRVLVVWDRATVDGLAEPAGFVTPRLELADLHAMVLWGQRIGGPPHVRAVIPVPADPRTGPDHGPYVAVAWSMREPVQVRARLGVASDHLDLELERLVTSGHCPQSITQLGSHPRVTFAVIAERRPVRFRWIRGADQTRLADLLEQASKDNELPVCVFREPSRRATFGCVLARASHRAPRAAAEFDLEPHELLPTLVRYAVAGWRLVSLIADTDPHLSRVSAVWTQNLERDTRFFPMVADS